MTTLNDNLRPLDRWSLVHVGAGAAAGATDMPFGWWLALSSIYEILEIRMESDPRNVFGSRRPESAQNFLVDVLVGSAGWWVGKKLLGGYRRPDARLRRGGPLSPEK